MNTQHNDTVSETALIASNAPDLGELAAKMAVKLDNDPAAVLFMSETVEAAEVARRGPVAMLHSFIIKLYREELPLFPRVIPDAENESPHKFQVEEPKAGGGTKKVWKDFYAEIAEDTKAGKADRHIVQQVSIAMSDNPGEAEAKYQTMEVSKLESLKKAANNRITNRRRLIREAMQVLHQMTDINDRFAGNIVAEFNCHDSGELVESADAIYCFNAKRPGKQKTFTAKSFIALDLENIAAKGGTFDALVAAASRSKKGTAPGSDKFPAFKGADDLETVVYRIAAFGTTDDGTMNLANKAAVIKGISKDLEYAESFADAFMFMNTIYNECGDFIAKAVEARAKQEQAKTLAKSAA